MRFTNIQALRALAAGMVLLFHATYYAKQRFGYPLFADALRGTWTTFAVPLFLVISGFVLTHSIRTAPPGRFLLARAIRIYPGFWLATVIAAVAMAITGWPDSLSLVMRLKHVGWSLRPGEFGSRLFILGVEWSLVFEVVLYLWLAAVSLLGTVRGVAIAAAVWLAVLVVKMIGWPEFAMNSPENPLPTWGTVFLSVVNVPFLFGVLIYQVREFGRAARWPVLAAIAMYLALVPGCFVTLEAIWFVYSFAAAAIVWFALQAPQLRERHPLVRAGDWSYGLYLAHVPLVTGGFAILVAAGWLIGTAEGVILVTLVALAGGLSFGWVESALHRHFRPLLNLRVKLPALRLPLRQRSGL
jgi:peptidoglycan/LPS O-acetylase OafA/YrhL